MKISSGSLARSSGDDKVLPPGFRFHPSDEELILYYLKRKICGKKIEHDVICDTDVYKWEPEELPGLSKLKTGDRQWYFFSPRNRKYPNGAKSNRGTRHGYWKATGRYRTVTGGSRDVGLKKTLVFYKGRAPSGERTDWVMHEYTLDEEELSNCMNMKNYYALYKVFKKSGRGPKNGEQYGAPFKEEDWADDEFYDFNDSNDLDIPFEKANKVAAVTDEEENCQTALFSLDDLEESIQKFPKDILEFAEADPSANSLPQVAGQEIYESTAGDLHSQAHIFSISVEVSHANRQPCNVGGSLDFTEAAVSEPQSFKTHEATSAPNFGEQASVLFEDDFLEMNDLDGPEITVSSTEKPVGSWQFRELNDLCEFDQWHDALMFLNDLGPVGCGTAPSLYKNDNSSNVADPLYNHFQTNLDCANASQISKQLQMHVQVINGFALSEQHQALVDQQTSGVLCDASNFAAETDQNQVLDGQFQSNLDCTDASQINAQMQMNVPAVNGFALSEQYQDLVDQQISGVLCDPSNFAAETNQNQVNEDGSAANSMNHALWTFVESIPTTPASAAENAWVNRTLDRMSSFGRRISTKSTTGSAIDFSSQMTRRTGRNRGFFLFSVLGTLCAVLWVFIRAIRPWKRCVSLNLNL